MHIKLAYGREGLWVNLPEDANITVIEPKFAPAVADEQKSISNALHHPIGSPPLRELISPHDTVAIVFSDITRPMPNDLVLPILIEEISKAGVTDDHITLINGLASHRKQTDEELIFMLGEELTNRFRIVQHDACDSVNLADCARNHAGRTVRVNRHYLKASVRILTGFIEPHFFAGFSGGPKAVLPAIADLESIMDNHDAHMIGHERSTWAVTRGNPIWEEMFAIASATQPTFILNVALNKNKKITGVFAGDLLQAHFAGTEFVRENAMRPVEQLFDVVITSNSGYPLDLNLYQAVKGISAAAQIVREGGDILIAAECWDGIPTHGEYAKLLRESDSIDDLYHRIMQPGFRCQDQWQAQIQARIQMKANVHVFADGLSDQELIDAKVSPSHSIEETLAGILKHRPYARVAILPEGPQTVPYLAQKGPSSAHSLPILE